MFSRQAVCRFGLVLIPAALIGIFPAGAQAQVATFAQFSEAGGSSPFVYTDNSGTSGTISIKDGSSSSTQVFFRFQGVAISTFGAPSGIQQASFTILHGTTTAPVQTVNSNIVQAFNAPGANATTLKFTRDSDGKNLLTVTFTNDPTSGNGLGGAPKGSTGFLSADTKTGAKVTFTSDFLNFSNTTDRAMSDELNAILSPPPSGSSGLREDPVGFAFESFIADITGQFSADLIMAPVPEPSSMLLAGSAVLLCGLGYRFRRGRKKAEPVVEGASPAV